MLGLIPGTVTLCDYDPQWPQDFRREADRLIEATVRKLLSEVMKNLSQSDKNTAAAEAEAANSMMEVMERGLSDEGDGGSDPKAAGGEGSAPGKGSAPNGGAAAGAPRPPAANG